MGGESGGGESGGPEGTERIMLDEALTLDLVKGSAAREGEGGHMPTAAGHVVDEDEHETGWPALAA